MNLSYPSVDKFSEIVRKKGRQALMYKSLLSRAYRQLPLDPGDIHFMGSAWRGRLFIHRVAMMGMWPGAMMYQRTTAAVVFAMEEEDFDVMNYIDDLIGAEREDRAWQAFKYLGVVLEDLGLVEKQSKEVSPRQMMDCLGVIFDFIHFTMSLTQEGHPYFNKTFINTFSKII